jgi:hypothetical protein
MLSSALPFPYGKRYKCTGKCQLSWKVSIEKGELRLVLFEEFGNSIRQFLAPNSPKS